MRRRLRWAWLWAALALMACRAASEAELPSLPEEGDPDVEWYSPLDMDADGLCDQTESELGTDPQAVDSDGDGLPDLVEVAMAYDAGDPLSPDGSALAYLASREGSEATFRVSVSVEGHGEAFVGAFQPKPPVFDLPQRARDFYRGAVAVSADPIDNVREQSASGARFGAVIGPARLRFELRFEQGLPEPDLRDCVVPHPFGFTVKADDGLLLSNQEYLLIVGPEDDLKDGDAFCLPQECF